MIMMVEELPVFLCENKLQSQIQNTTSQSIVWPFQAIS